MVFHAQADHEHVRKVGGYADTINRALFTPLLSY